MAKIADIIDCIRKNQMKSLDKEARIAIRQRMKNLSDDDWDNARSDIAFNATHDGPNWNVEEITETLNVYHDNYMNRKWWHPDWRIVPALIMFKADSIRIVQMLEDAGRKQKPNPLTESYLVGLRTKI